MLTSSASSSSFICAASFEGDQLHAAFVGLLGEMGGHEGAFTSLFAPASWAPPTAEGAAALTAAAAAACPAAAGGGAAAATSTGDGGGGGGGAVSMEEDFDRLGGKVDYAKKSADAARRLLIELTSAM